MNQFFTAVFSFLTSFVLAQNLIPNPSFETHSTCPVGFSQYTGYVSNWTNPSAASPDYYHACANPNPAGTPVNGFGYQSPRTGSAYSGFYATAGTYREFIQVQLTSALVAGTSYTFNMYVNCHNRSKWVTDDLGAYISVTAPTSAGTGFLPGNPVPQIKNPSGHLLLDTMNWELISGTYIASGGERYVTIGHFLDDVLSSYVQVNYGSQGGYYYIDDVSLVPSTPLPVELVSFSAEAREQAIQLEWATASETGNAYFEIERSGDGTLFTYIGKLPGNGNSTNTNEYNFDDNEIQAGLTYYYRLRQVDYDGKATYSGIVSAKWMNEKNVFGFYPNPSGANLHVHTSASGVRVFDLMGKEIFSMLCQQENFEMNTEAWNPGIYFLEADWQDEQKTFKLVVE